jgi:tetratricopeptide (TPR) repeat protein
VIAPVPPSGPDVASPVLVQDAFATALALHRQGRLADADGAYQAILAGDPQHVPTLCCLSLCRLQRGRSGDAGHLGRRAVTLAPGSFEAWFSFGNASTALGAGRDAIGQLSRCLRARPDFAEACNNLGNLLFAAGLSEQAERMFRRSLCLAPAYAQASYNLGNLLASQRRDSEALAAFDRAATMAPPFVEAHNNRGVTLHRLGRFAEARAAFALALERRPDYADAWFNLGNLLQATGCPEQALAACRQAIAADPAYLPAYANLGGLQLSCNRPGAGIAPLLRAHRVDPGQGAVLNNLGNVLLAAAHPDQAFLCFRRAAILAPDDGEAWLGLGNSRAKRHRLGEARRLFARSLAVRPDFADAWNNQGAAWQAQQRHDRAVLCFQTAIGLCPSAANAYDNLGTSLQALDRPDEARAAYRRAITLAPDDATAHANLGIALTEVGTLDLARQSFRQAAGLAPRCGQIHRLLAETGPVDADHRRQMEALLADDGALPDEERMELHFALAKAYADAGRPQDSFRQLLSGNRLMRATITYDEADTLALFDRIRASIASPLPGPIAPPGLPIIIVGMPRSGTTLVEQILASHPAVFGAGELTLLPQLTEHHLGRAFPEILGRAAADGLRDLTDAYLRRLAALAPNALRITDKMPGNFKLLGLIAVALPQARVIHLSRDPVATCLSCFSKLFAGQQPYAYDLAELGRYYRAYHLLMEHWRQVLPRGLMLEVRYETLVDDLAGQTRRMLDHCGLPWDDRCLDFHRTGRVVRTASAQQVRQPINRDGIARWQAFADLAAPLLAALDGLPPAPAK